MDAAINLVDQLIVSAAVVVTILTDGMLSRTLSLRGGPKSLASETELSDFLNQYLIHLESPIAVQVWPAFVAYAREVLLGSTHVKRITLPCLDAFVTLATKICESSSIEERRIQKEVQDLCTRLIESTVQLANGDRERGIWDRIAGHERDLGTPKIRSDTFEGD